MTLDFMVHVTGTAGTMNGFDLTICDADSLKLIAAEWVLPDTTLQANTPLQIVTHFVCNSRHIIVRLSPRGSYTDDSNYVFPCFGSGLIEW
jgi:hypothetical protein